MLFQTADISESQGLEHALATMNFRVRLVVDDPYGSCVAVTQGTSLLPAVTIDGYATTPLVQVHITVDIMDPVFLDFLMVMVYPVSQV